MAIQGKVACLRMIGAYDEAEREASRALTEKGPHPGILNELAWLCCEKGDYAQASQYFEKVLAITPNDPYAHVNLAGCLIKEGEKAMLERASLQCRKALSFDPTLPEARGCLGVVAFKQGRIGEAEMQLRKSVESCSRDGSYADLGALFTRMGRYEDAEQMLKKGLAIKGADAPLHLELGNLYVQTDKSRGAIGEFRQAMAIDPKNPEPVRALAVALMEGGRLVEAETVLRNAIRGLDESRRWRLHITLCQLLTRLADEAGDSELCGEALKEANSAMVLASKEPDVHFCCGIVRFKLEDYREALHYFRGCQKLDKSRVDAEINARKVKRFIVQEKLRSRRLASLTLSAIILGQLALLWWWRLKYGVDEKHAVVTSTMLTVLVPLCLGLVVVSILLPSLTKLKLTGGFEAELSQPQAKDTLASGPKGQIGFGSSFLGTSGALAGGARPKDI
jgi:Flp pilus assembly protein TadD